MSGAGHDVVEERRLFFQLRLDKLKNLPKDLGIREPVAIHVREREVFDKISPLESRARVGSSAIEEGRGNRNSSDSGVAVAPQGFGQARHSSPAEMAKLNPEYIIGRQTTKKFRIPLVLIPRRTGATMQTTAPRPSIVASAHRWGQRGIECS